MKKSVIAAVTAAVCLATTLLAVEATAATAPSSGPTTTVADYIAIQDSSTTLSPPGVLPGLPDAHQFTTFDAPSLNVAFRPVLTFRVNPQLDDGESITVTFMLNGDSIGSQLFDTDMHRSWQEIFDAGILREDDNVLVVNAHGDGDVVISDVVILYKREV
jgi:hypothetical protein